MERINQIMTHPLYQQHRNRIEQLEQDRKFCRHGLNHCLDVARILYIKVLEEQLPIAKDVVYATAILHDIGRDVQYEEEIPHHRVGAEIAAEILKDCGFSSEEIVRITEAIRLHHKKENEDVFNALLYRADKLSRNCFDCKAADECYWELGKRNSKVSI